MILYLHNTCDEDEYFNYLYDTYYNYAYKICFNILGTDRMIDDTLQDSFLKIYKTMGRIKSKAAAKSWIGTIVRNTAINALISEHDKADVVEFNEEWFDNMLDNVENIPVQSLIVKEGIESILTEIRKLDKKYSDILLLKYYFEFEFDEIAQLLHTPIKTVYTRHDRSIKRLRTKLSPVMDVNKVYEKGEEINEAKQS